MGFKHALSWAGYRFTSTILDDIQYQVLFFATFAAMVCAVSQHTSTNLGINNVMITVVGTVVSLTVSFKTNSAYARWWEGRNVWANLTSSSRHLAMLIWMHVPNVKPAPKEAEKDDKSPKKKPRFKGKIKSRPKSISRRSRVSLGTDTSEPTENQLKGFSVQDTPQRQMAVLKDHSRAATPASAHRDHLAESGAAGGGYSAGHAGTLPPGVKGKLKERDLTGTGSRPGSVSTTLGEKHLSKAEKVKMREQVAGMVEKKTYIGLVQAFSVAMKHALRGESGPFYTDLYSLIAFLPKYNPSVLGPVTRDHLFVGWDNGIPRQKVDYDDDSIAVPLTSPAAFSGYAFEMPSEPDKINHPPPSIDQEKIAESNSFTTTSYAFRHQALTSAAAYVRTEGESRRHCFARLDKKHRVIRQSEDKRQGNVAITTVELMPPRHPPVAQYWDFFPPLRLVKVVTDWIRKRELVQKQERVRGGKRKRNGGVKSEIPQEILMYLSAYIDDLVRREMLNASYIGPLLTCIFDLQKELTDLEKIASTPIPSAYSFHLHLTVWAYLLFLPFQVYPLLGWVTVPAVAVAAITYLGFLEIGAQIEMPFPRYTSMNRAVGVTAVGGSGVEPKDSGWGDDKNDSATNWLTPQAYDQSDLDLDKFTLKIAHQLAEVTAVSFVDYCTVQQGHWGAKLTPQFPCDVPSSQIILSHLNQPLLPTSALSAPDLLGVCETRPVPTSRGFSAAFEAVKHLDIPSSASSTAKKRDKGKKVNHKSKASLSHSSSSSSSSSSSTGSSHSSDTESDDHGNNSNTDTESHAAKSIPKTVRDLELALSVNWRTISSATDNFIGKPRQQLENRSGVEVAVMTL